MIGGKFITASIWKWFLSDVQDTDCTSVAYSPFRRGQFVRVAVFWAAQMLQQ